MSALLYHTTKLTVGLLYPAYSSFKAVHTKNVKEYVKWMMYWIVFAFFLLAEALTDLLLYWLPFYVELKLIFLIWLMTPLTRGSSILYRKFIHPQLVRHEKEIDGYMNQVRDQGYQALITLGARGFNFATDIVLTTAIKGSDQLRRSWSLSDLSSTDGKEITTYRRFARTSSLRSRSSSMSSEDDEENERYRQDLEGNQVLVRRQDVNQNLSENQIEDIQMRRRDVAGNKHLEALDRELLTNQELLRQRRLLRATNKRQSQDAHTGAEISLADGEAQDSASSPVCPVRKHRQNRLDVRDPDLYLTGGVAASNVSRQALATVSAAAAGESSAAVVRPTTAGELKSSWLARTAHDTTAATTAGSTVTLYKRN